MTPNEILSAYAEHLGIPLDPSERDTSEPMWDGATLWTYTFSANGWDLAHEIAHWIVASDSQRAMPNYGLGTDWMIGSCEQVVPLPGSTHQEFEASALGIEMTRVLGGDWQAHAWDHSWLDATYAETGPEEQATWMRWAGRVENHTADFENWLAHMDPGPNSRTTAPG